MLILEWETGQDILQSYKGKVYQISCILVREDFCQPNNYSLVGSDFVCTGLKLIKETIPLSGVLEASSEVYIDEIRIKWHNIIRLVSYRKPIRIKIRSIIIKEMGYLLCA